MDELSMCRRDPRGGPLRTCKGAHWAHGVSAWEPVVHMQGSPLGT